MKAFAWPRGAGRGVTGHVGIEPRLRRECFLESIPGLFLFFGNAAIHAGRFLTPLAVTLPRRLLRLRAERP